MTSSERMSEEGREYPTVKPGDTVTIEVTGIDGKVYRTRCQIVDSTAPRKATCGYCKDCKWRSNTNDVDNKVFCNSPVVASYLLDPGALYVPVDFGCVQWEAKDG